MYNDDCINVLKNLEKSSIDIVLTDIPYGISYSEWDVIHKNNNSALCGSTKHQKEDTTFRKRGKPINGWSEADKKIPYEYQEWCMKWSKELYRVTKEGSPILIFSSRRLQHRVCNALEDSGFMVRDILIWKKDKCNAKAQRISNVMEKRGVIDVKYANYRLGNLAPYYEPIIFAMKPYKHTLTDCVLRENIGGIYCKDDKIPSNILEVSCNKKNKYHETEKPVELLEKLINIFSINQNHVILDFTMGSGSTGVACMNLGRRFIGVELNEGYFNIAKARIEEVQDKLERK